MSETNDTGEQAGGRKQTLSLRRGGVEKGTVRQSFSHGRTKSVVVEKKKQRRVMVPGQDAPAPAAEPRRQPAAPAAEAPRRSPAQATEASAPTPASETPAAAAQSDAPAPTAAASAPAPAAAPTLM